MGRYSTTVPYDLYHNSPSLILGSYESGMGRVALLHVIIDPPVRTIACRTTTHLVFFVAINVPHSNNQQLKFEIWS